MKYDIGKGEVIWERIYGTDEKLHYLITSLHPTSDVTYIFYTALIRTIQ